MQIEAQAHPENDIALLLDWHERDISSRVMRSVIVSASLHFLVLILLITAPVSWTTSRRSAEESRVARRVTPLIAPRFELTQKAPNRGKIDKEVDLESLLPKPRINLARAAPKAAPPPAPPAPRTRAPIPVPEPPKIDVAQQRDIPPPVQSGIPDAPPPPRIQAEEKPKLAFETPGAQGGAPNGSRSGALGRIAPPKTSVDDIARSVARGGGQGALIVGDVAELPGLLSPGMTAIPQPSRIGSNLELLSDPQGVDFKPYLIKVLSAVRRNWFAVIPESVKLGRRGKVLIQFSIDQTGNVPKLVIAMPSGAEALDRAAVAGISASNPFPPLPPEFKGEQIRLQFAFLYNTR